MMGMWVGLAAALMGYNARPFGAGFFPAFHLWLYTTAGLILLSASALGRVIPRQALVPVAIAAVYLQWPAYASRADFRVGRAQSLTTNPNFSLASAFLHRTLRPDDVVLGS